MGNCDLTEISRDRGGRSVNRADRSRKSCKNTTRDCLIDVDMFPGKIGSMIDSCNAAGTFWPPEARKEVIKR